MRRESDTKIFSPANLLIKGENILYADFNISRVFKVEEVKTQRPISDDDYDRMASKSLGVSEKTPMYCAPEVARERPRGRKADIFSLGCVYLEMMSVLCGKSLDDLAFHRINNRFERAYHANFTKTTQWIFMLVAKLYLDQTTEAVTEGVFRTASEALTADTIPCKEQDERFRPLEWCIAMLQPKDDDRISAANLLRVIRAWEVVRQRKISGASISLNTAQRCHVHPCCSISTQRLDEPTTITATDDNIAVHLLERWPLVKALMTSEKEPAWKDEPEFTVEEVNRLCGYVPPVQ